jgi:ATP-dependent Clp protease protease subunit
MGGAMGQASDLEITTREINKVKTEIVEIIAEHTGQDIEKVRNDCDRDYWLTAKEAVDYGAIDMVIRKKKKPVHE